MDTNWQSAAWEYYDQTADWDQFEMQNKIFDLIWSLKERRN